MRHSPPVTVDHVLEQSNIEKAIRAVTRKKGAPGVDGISTKQLRSEWIGRSNHTIESIRAKVYQATPVRSVRIPKLNDGERILGIPTVTDRMLQQAVLIPLTKQVDPTFEYRSFGFRPRRSTHMAIEHARDVIVGGHPIVTSLDIANCL